MKNSQLKYSIIVPVHNGINYLPSCVETIINQDYKNYELIISDDHSTDGTDMYLNKLVHPNIRIIHPDKQLSMVEHFEWSLSHAQGEWIMFVGGDDGLQSYFFALAEKLTKIADEKKIRTITSERAYFFWPGCEAIYGKLAVSYYAIDTVQVLNTKIQALWTLLGFKTYFELPQMYTTSLFKRSLIEEAKQKQNGVLFSTIPPDANLAAISCSLEAYYLKSLIPLGWVGTSPNGVVITMESVPKNKLSPNANIGYHQLSGDFALRSCSIYFWNALIMTKSLRKQIFNKILSSHFFRTIIFSGVLAEIKSSTKIDAKPRILFFEEMLHINHCNKVLVEMYSYILPCFYKMAFIKNAIYSRFIKLYRSSFIKNESWEKETVLNLNKISLKINREFALKILSLSSISEASFTNKNEK